MEKLSDSVVEMLLEEKPRPLDTVVKAGRSVLFKSCALTDLTEDQDLK